MEDFIQQDSTRANSELPHQIYDLAGLLVSMMHVIALRSYSIHD